MGAKLLQAVVFNMFCRIAAGADRLSLQRFFRIFSRHFTGDHTIQIFFQQKLIDQVQAGLRLYNL